MDYRVRTITRNGFAVIASTFLAGVLVVACGSSTTTPIAVTTIKTPSAPKVVPLEILPLPKDARSMTPVAADGTFWVIAGPETSVGLFRYALTSRSVISSTSVSNLTDSLAVTGTGALILGAGQMSTETSSVGSIALYRVASTSSPVQLPVSGAVLDLVGDQKGGSVSMLEQVGAQRVVVSMDAITGALQRSISVALNTTSFVVSPDGHTLFALTSSGIVDAYSTSTNSLISSFKVGNSGRSIAISPNGALLYVLKGQGTVRNVEIVDVATEQGTRAIPAPADTVEVTLGPGGNHLYDLVGSPSFGNLQEFPAS